MDAVHPTQATKITAGWIRKGVDNSINTTGSRTRLNIEGAIRLGHLSEVVIEQYHKTVNGESIVDFLNRTRDFIVQVALSILYLMALATIVRRWLLMQ